MSSGDHWGDMQIPTMRAAPRAARPAAASATEGEEKRMPAAAIHPAPSALSSARACATVMRMSGEPPMRA